MMHFARILSIAIGVFLSVFASVAQAITMDFEDLETTGGWMEYIGGTYSFGDFTLTNLSSSGTTAFAVPETNNVFFNTGSAALLNNRVNGVTELTATDGSAFDLEAMDLSELSTFSPGNTNVSFTGTYEDGSTVQQSFDLDGVFGMETVYFSGFDSVVSVTWTQTADYHQFDNISVEISPVPLPASSLLLGSVMAGGVLVSRRRRKAAA